MSQRTFDCLPSQFHPKMLAFAVATLVAEDHPRSYTWGCGINLDQGHQGACVPFGWSHEAAAKPKVWQNITNETALVMYHDVQLADEYPGEDYSGSSVNAGAIVSRTRGWIDQWWWAKDTREVVLALGRGPVVIGVDWLSGMEDPDAGGWVHAEGVRLGGHCTLLRGIRLVWKPDAGTRPYHQPDWFDRLDTVRSYALIHNSWGKGWGLNGTAKISLSDLQVLIDRGGEACLPTRLDVSREG